MLESTAAIYSGKIVDTGAKQLPLIHVYMNSNLIFDCIKELSSKTRTHLSKIIDHSVSLNLGIMAIIVKLAS